MLTLVRSFFLGRYTSIDFFSDYILSSLDSNFLVSKIFYKEIENKYSI